MIGGPDMANKSVLLFSCTLNLNLFLVAYTRMFKNKLKAYYSIYNNTNFNANANITNSLGPYLAGLFEGDGHIWIQKQKGSKMHNPRFCITFSLKNETLCKKLLDVIGSGFIRYKRKENACVLVISPVIGLKKVVNLINGELKTPALWCRISHIVGKKLSNSGDFLKLTVLSQMRKYLWGLINYSGTVTNREIQETEIGNRGSKSNVCLTLSHPSQWIKHIIVKEQRVYGNCIELNTFKQRNVPMLRCTLTGFERNYQVRILSNQLKNVRFNSSINKDKTQPNINPWFLTGFADGEACFLVNIYKSSSHLNGWGARATFQIGLHNKDISVLYAVKDYFGVGSVTTKTKGCVFYVQAIKDLGVILNHFDRYPLVTKKYADYLLFKLAINLIKDKAHLNSEGLRKLVAIRASLNWGLSSDLEAAFPGIIPYPRPEVSDITIKDPKWLAGFTSAEGCFLVKITKAVTHRSGYQVSLIFKLTQHSRDEQLIRYLVNYLGYGIIYQFDSATEYRVTRLSDLTDKIVPLFQKFPIQGVKFLDYKDFVTVLELMNNKLHLTPEGLEKIKIIKENMNKGRK